MHDCGIRIEYSQWMHDCGIRIGYSQWMRDCGIGIGYSQWMRDRGREIGASAINAWMKKRKRSLCNECIIAEEKLGISQWMRDCGIGIGTLAMNAWLRKRNGNPSPSLVLYLATRIYTVCHLDPLDPLTKHSSLCPPSPSHPWQPSYHTTTRVIIVPWQ